jgi:hypothetical protein
MLLVLSQMSLLAASILAVMHSARKASRSKEQFYRILFTRAQYA